MKEQHKPKKNLLLLEDVEGLGRSGEVVKAKPGFARNFLFPQKKAVIADKTTVVLQAKLKEEREKRAIVDRKEAEKLAVTLGELTLTTKVKVDPQGKMYGSVTALDIITLLKEKGYEMRRQNIQLAHPIKTTGKHTIGLKLKEGVMAKVMLDIASEVVAELPQELRAEAPAAPTE